MSYLNQIIDRASKKERIQKMTRDEAVLSVIQADPQLYRKYVSECRKAALTTPTESPAMVKIKQAVAQLAAETGASESDAMMSYLFSDEGQRLYAQHVAYVRKNPAMNDEDDMDEVARLDHDRSPHD